MYYNMLIYLASQQDKENSDKIKKEIEVNHFTESTKVPNLILYKVNVTVVIEKVVTMATLY